ncbi:hypothetical protein EDD29_6878 [Actinocorallia herbida]|uniref:Uncharacterized protein n=1 Tax=Actinocorallia herbida TaxID=58109 RepID=A0A3N1D6N6_9ACTN|nr:hypothetical protein EDD29_6878 [Actinocorallia herbida]
MGVLLERFPGLRVGWSGTVRHAGIAARGADDLPVVLDK